LIDPMHAFGSTRFLSLSPQAFADLANLEKMLGLDALTLSVGGAGVFDGIFIAGAAAMPLAGLTVSRPPTRA
jgi:hypothetical protein